MDEKTRALIDLLKELDEICVANGLEYTVGNEVLDSIIDNGVLPNSVDYISVAMTGGDQERFAEAVNGKIPNRFVENFLTNTNARRIETRFYNSETTRINLTNYHFHVNQGIYIKIVEVVKEPPKDPKLYLKLATVWKRSYMEERITKTSDKFFVGIMNAFKSVFGRDTVAAWLFNYRKKFYRIDKWNDIHNVLFVKAGRYKLKGNIVGETERVSTNEGEFSICRKFYGNRITKAVARETMQQVEICDVTVPFKDAMTDSFVEHLENARIAREKFMKVSDKGKEPRKVKQRGWNTYLMSRDVVAMKDLYTDDKIDQLQVLLNDGNLVDFDLGTEEYERVRKRWNTQNIPFYGIERLNSLVDKRNAM
ncbi:MAG: hypothetical protein KBS66_01020 [Eubacterium sp.]|nr:hypothetical protein [Candidatus Colimonas fimequi]